MPDIPAEAVQAAARAVGQAWADAVTSTQAEFEAALAKAAVEAAAPFLAGQERARIVASLRENAARFRGMADSQATVGDGWRCVEKAMSVEEVADAIEAAGVGSPASCPSAADIPTEAVQAAARANSEHYEVCGERDCGRCAMIYNAARRGLDAALRVMAGVGSPVSCPSAAPEFTQSPETPEVAPVYPPAPTEPVETLSALRKENTCLRREVAYITRTAEMWRRLWERVDGERSAGLLRAEQAEAAIARIDGLHQPKVITEIRYCDHHMAEARTRAVKPAEWQACGNCTSRPVVACSEIRCCVWPCEPHLILHGETADTCAHGAGAVSEEQTGGGNG